MPHHSAQCIEYCAFFSLQEDELNYTVILTDLQPQSIQHYKYQIEVL